MEDGGTTGNGRDVGRWNRENIEGFQVAPWLNFTINCLNNKYWMGLPKINSNLAGILNACLVGLMGRVLHPRHYWHLSALSWNLSCILQHVSSISDLSLLDTSSFRAPCPLGQAKYLQISYTVPDAKAALEWDLSVAQRPCSTHTSHLKALLSTTDPCIPSALKLFPI